MLISKFGDGSTELVDKFESKNGIELDGTRASDEIEAKYIEEDVRLKVTWNIA